MAIGGPVCQNCGILDGHTKECLAGKVVIPRDIFFGSGVDAIDDLFERQREFSKNFYDVSTMTEANREKMTLQLTAALHKEVSSLTDTINFETHRLTPKEVSLGNLKHECVDVFRYLTAILNVWGITSQEFVNASHDRDLFLTTRHRLESVPWEGQPVIITDLDDVITNFKEEFNAFIEATTDVVVEPDAKEYYPLKKLTECGLSSGEIFGKFIAEGHLRRLACYTEIRDVINELYDAGFWIHLVTARHDDNLTTKYDTYRWIVENDLKCHRITFAHEKFLWLADNTAYGRTGKITCALEDASKHAREYGKQGIPCLAPIRSYNTDLIDAENVHFYKSASELRNLVKILVERGK